jgi:hypothetical protein
MTMHARRLAVILVTVLVAALATVAVAQEKAGIVAALEGRADVQHPGQAAWGALAVGGDVLVRDRLRTAAASRLKLLLRDDSVLTLGPKSELVLDEQVVRPDAPATSHFSQLVGSLRAVVTERYGAAGASFEVKTPTAVAGVRGTGFVMLVDDDGKRTRVVGVYDTTLVRGTSDPRGRHEVHLGPMEMTEVFAGAFPSAPVHLSAAQFGALVQSTEMGAGGGEPGAGGGGAGGAGTGGGTSAGGGAGVGTSGAAAAGVPPEGSGDRGDPATPGPQGGAGIQRPDAAIDQPVERLRQRPTLPPPPPPNR